MKNLMERAVIDALLVYMKKRGIRQNELAKRLGWSTSDLNDTLKGRKGIGKNRQRFLEEKLGDSFRHELLFKIGELSDIEKQQPKQVAESHPEYMVGKYILTDLERDYVEKLLAILRGINKQAKFAAKMTIDMLYHYRKKRQNIVEG